MIPRYYDNLKEQMRDDRVLIMYGPRRTGKTTLVKKYLDSCKKHYLFESGDNIHFSSLMSSLDIKYMKDMLGEYELLVIDEAQEIPDIGKALKLLIDYVPNLSIIATGSSSFTLPQQAGEPLKGRKRTITLYPVAHMELKDFLGSYELNSRLEDFMIFGSYPEVVTAETRSSKIEILQELVQSYLLKDILSQENLRSPRALLNLLKLLAYQIGSEVSLNELSKSLNIDVKTVSRYIHLLEKTFVITTLTGFSRNLRKEVSKKSKYYFLDTGIRNGVINNFAAIPDRDDTGMLFENFLVIERLKKLSYSGFYGNRYFWRTYDKQEIDYIETLDETIAAYEFKWGNKTPKVPKIFAHAYPESTYTLISRINYLDFITDTH